MKTRIDVEIICGTCKTWFSIIGIDVMLQNTGVGGGFHLSNIKCPNCNGDDLDFDLMLVKGTDYHPLLNYVPDKFKSYPNWQKQKKKWENDKKI